MSDPAGAPVAAPARGDRAPAALAWAIGAVVAAVASFVVPPPGATGLLHGVADETLLVPLARWKLDPGLYAGDAWLALARDVFSHAYSWILGAVLRFVDDPVAAERALAFPFLVVFLAGTFRVVAARAGRNAAFHATWGAALLARVLATTSDAGAWPLDAGAGLPRDLVFALLPWIWIAHEATSGAFASGARGAIVRRGALLLGVGALSAVHPLTAVHLVALLAVLELVRVRSWSGVGAAAFDGVCGAVGVVPYLVQWLAFPKTPGHAPREALLWRIGGIGADTPSIWTGRMETALWLAAAGLALSAGRAGAGVRSLRRALVACLVLAAAAPALNLVVPGIQFDRLTRVAVWIAVVLAACGAASAAARTGNTEPDPELPVRRRHFARAAAAAACVALAVAGPLAVRAATGAPRGPLEWVVRRAEVRLGLGETAAPHVVPEREGRAGDPSLDAARAAAFLDVCDWVRAETPPDALFAVPPEDWGAFRAYACRGTVVTRKDGGFALSFLGGRGNDWLAEYRDAIGVYASRDADRWTAWAAARGFTHVVLDDDAAPVPAGWTVLRTSGPYRVLAVPPPR